MNKKRLDRDLKWGFQGFPYYQIRVDIEELSYMNDRIAKGEQPMKRRSL